MMRRKVLPATAVWHHAQVQHSPTATRRAPVPAAPRSAAVPVVDRAPVFWTVIGLLGALLVFNLVWHMADQNIGDWDEGRQAVNAFEMWRSGDLLVNTYRGAVDYWNLKPPLALWPVIASFQLFGPSTFALRVPEVLETVGTGVVLVLFASRRIGRRGAIATAAVFATCYPLIGTHSGRSGDPDALFVLFCTIAMLAVLLAPERPAFLLLWTTAASAAFLTKSWHAGIVLAAGAVFLLLRGRSSVARPRDYLIALLGFVPVFVWAAARFAFDGVRFFETMVSYDLLSRSSSALEGNSGAPYYYLERLAYMAPWLALLLVPMFGGPAARRAIRVRDALQSWRTSGWLGPAVFAVLIFGLYSLAKTKLAWYVWPAFPALALLVGIAATAVTRHATRRTVALLVASITIGAVGAEAYVLDKIPMPQVAPQVALARLDGAKGVPVYLDPELALPPEAAIERAPAQLGEWSQSLRSAAMLNAGVDPEDGGARAFQAAPGRRLMLVEVGSATDEQLASLPVHVASTADGYRVIELRG